MKKKIILLFILLILVICVYQKYRIIINTRSTTSIDNFDITKTKKYRFYPNLQEVVYQQGSLLDGYLRNKDYLYGRMYTMKGLENLYHLKTVILEGQSIKKIEGLDNCKDLEDLRLMYNNIEKIEGLENLKNLTYLNLNDNNISKIEGLESLKNLTYLNLAGNNISKIQKLNNLSYLRSIDLSDNKVSKIENIENIPLIRNDYCYENSGIANCVEEPKSYYTKYLNNIYFEEGEEVSPLRDINLTGNKVISITQESLDYINKYKIAVYLGESEKTVLYHPLYYIPLNYETWDNGDIIEGTYNENWAEDYGLEII
ncbi:MAG: leucine-rich repeat domain-containing protein [Mycoplasmatales bacterium]